MFIVRSTEYCWVDLGAFCGCGPGNWSSGSMLKARLNADFSVTHSQSRYDVHRGCLFESENSENHFTRINGARKIYCICVLRCIGNIVSRLYQA